MTNLPVPIMATVQPGSLITGALWNANVGNGVTFATNVPVFLGYQTAVQSMVNSTLYNISLDTAAVDSYGGHSNSSNNSRYVAQVAGWYLLHGSISYAANATGARAAWLHVNGNPISGASAIAGNAGASQSTNLNVPGFVYMNVGDYVELSGAQYSGAALSTASVAGQQSCLIAVWIHA